MNTLNKHSSSSSPTYRQQLLYHQQQQYNHGQQQYYQQQQTTEQQQLAQSRRAVLKLHSRLHRQLQQPQPQPQPQPQSQHQHNQQQLQRRRFSSINGDNLCSSVNWQMENYNSNVSNSNARFGVTKSSALISTQFYQSLSQPLYQSLQQYMNQMHQSYFSTISKLQKKIARLESTLKQFVITKIKNQKHNNTKWFEKQVMYEREINQLKQRLYFLQRQKLNSFKKQSQRQSQQQEEQQQQQKSLLEGIDDELQQWQNNKLLEINKFINSSVAIVDGRQSNKSVSRCQQSMMPVTLRNQTTEQQTIKDINKFNLVQNINSNNNKPNQYRQQSQQKYKQSITNTPKSNTNILQHNKLSHPEQILRVDEQLLSQLSNSNQIEQVNLNKKSYKITQQNQQQQQQQIILARQQSQVQEFNYNIGYSISSNYNNQNKLKSTVVKSYLSCNHDKNYDNNNKNNNNKIDTKNIKTNNTRKMQLNYYTPTPQQQLDNKYQHEYIPSLINSQQLQQNYSFTYEQKFILDQIQHLKHILQDKKDRQQSKSSQQQGINMLQRVKMIKKDQYDIQYKGGTQQKKIAVTEKKKQKQIIDSYNIRNNKDISDRNQTMRKKQKINRTQIKGTLIQKLNQIDKVDQIKIPKSKQSMQNTQKSNQIKYLPQTAINKNIYNQSQHLSHQLQQTKQRQLFLQQTLVQLKQSICQMRSDLYSLLPCQYCGLRGQLMQVL